MEDTELFGWLMVVFGLNVTVRGGRGGDVTSGARGFVPNVEEGSKGDDSVAEEAILILVPWGTTVLFRAAFKIYCRLILDRLSMFSVTPTVRSSSRSASFHPWRWCRIWQL